MISPTTFPKFRSRPAGRGCVTVSASRHTRHLDVSERGEGWILRPLRRTQDDWKGRRFGHAPACRRPGRTPLSCAAFTVALWPALFIVCATACTSPRPGIEEPRVRQEVPILDQISGSYSRLTRPVRVVIRDRATLARLPLAEIEVDFDQHMILLAGLGPTFRSGAGIRIVSVRREGSRLRVQERQITGGLDEPSPPRRYSPWTMVVIPHSDLNVEGYSARVPPGAMALD